MFDRSLLTYIAKGGAYEERVSIYAILEIIVHG